jgi:hypothetical protein
MWTLAITRSLMVAAPRKKSATKSTAKKKVTAKRAAQGYKTLQLADNKSFFTFKITKQTVYWTILVAFIIFMQLWILKVQLDVVQATDNLDQQINSNN